MKVEIKHLTKLELREGKVELYGENGSLCIIPFLHFFHVEYTINSEHSSTDNIPQVLPAANTSTTAFNKSYDAIKELEDKFVIIQGDARLEVAKETGVISVYWKERLAFGGAIGNSDTVLPKFPLRIRAQSQELKDKSVSRDWPGEWPARFNFRSDPEDIFWGLGEKTGKLNKAYRRFKMFNRDALGYNPEFSDPMYISIPFYFQVNRRRSTIAAVYFPSEAVEEIDFLAESNFYTAVSLAKGPYAYIVFVGDTYREILANYLEVIGKPALPPKFAFGFFGSSMSYTEPSEAQQKIIEYFNKIEKYKIPCEGMYFSSGYIKAQNGRRYTFIWNKEKFPNPKEFIQTIHARGYRICCNLKPGFLIDHPWYEKLKAEKYFIEDERGQAAVEYYWGNYASLIDFSNEAAYSWWKEQIKKNFLELGISGIWNDNNEFELEDDGIQSKKSWPVLMSKASYEASQELFPGKRPWIISRAGFTGIQKFASTWSGDNVSDEKSMIMNIPMGFNLGLSGLFFYGHDIGGFYGPKPEKELLLRWCQSAVFQPRFIMHSWNPDGIPTEPWLYPEILDTIRSLIKLRYKFLPYLYSSAIRSVIESVPLEIPLWLEYFEDYALDADSLNHLVGDCIMVVPPRATGEHEVECRFPQGSMWISSDLTTWYQGESSLQVQYPEKQPLYFFKEGSAIAFESKESGPLEGYRDRLNVLVIPVSSETGQPSIARVYEDDGLSDVQEGSYYCFEFLQHKVGSTNMELSVKMKDQAFNGPIPRKLKLTLPPEYAFVLHQENETTLHTHYTLEFFNKDQTAQVEIVKVPDSSSPDIV